MEATPDKKKENTALYIVYAAAAYFGLQFLLKPKRAAAAAVVTYPTASSPASQTTTTPVPETYVDPASTSSATTWIAESFPLRKGMKGSKVKALQQKLGVTADGAFGNNTETALLKKYGVSTVSQTQYQSIIGGQAKQTSTAATTTTWIAESFPLRKGMKGASVKTLQQKLGITADGAFGANTEAALQQQYGISTVSKAQYQTIISGQSKTTATTATPTPGSWIAESFPLRKGMKGNSVKALQQKLGLTADGAFGSNTEAAVIKKYGVTTVSQDLFRSITQPVASTITNFLNIITPKPANSQDNSPILKSGSKGADVYRLQKWLGFKDKKVAKKGEPIADSAFGKQTLAALQKKTGQSFISVNHLNTLMKQMAGMGYAGEILVTKRAATILDSNLLPHRTVPENTILGTRMMELSDPQEQRAYTQFKTVDGFHRWVDKDAV